MLKKSEILEMLEIFDEKIGQRKSELNYKNPYTFAVAVLLSAQATDKSVNIATAELFEIADNPKTMLSLGLDEIKKYIRTIGLFNSKAKHIMEMSQTLVEKFDGILPKTRDELMQLSGIGRKSANVILNELYGLPTIGVDTHVLRLVKRLGLMGDEFNTPEEVESELERIIPEKYKPFISNYLVLFGRYICKAKNPDCANCYLKKFCKIKKI
ncbi:MAG: endonuclease III [Alphaproteobacteria bacterium]|nr:endonuclease III [Alphaproteobacteria bacterium]